MSIKIEIFASPGCGKCGVAKEALHKLVSELGLSQIQLREVNILEEMDYAVEIGVLSTPSIAIDGELVFTSLPSVNKMRTEIQRRLLQ